MKWLAYWHKGMKQHYLNEPVMQAARDWKRE
jgi:hypothetical protein